MLCSEHCLYVGVRLICGLTLSVVLLKYLLRAVEWTFRRTSDPLYLTVLISCLRSMHSMFRVKKANYTANLISMESGDPILNLYGASYMQRLVCRSLKLKLPTLSQSSPISLLTRSCKYVHSPLRRQCLCSVLHHHVLWWNSSSSLRKRLLISWWIIHQSTHRQIPFLHGF